MSRFHRVSSDEVWNPYRGEGVRLLLWDGSATLPSQVTLAAVANVFCHVAPARRLRAMDPALARFLPPPERRD